MGFVVNAYVARILNVEGFGLINYSLAFLTYLLLFSNMGLTTLGVREVAKDKENRKIIGEIIGTKLFLTLILYIVFLPLLLVIPGNPLAKRIILLYLITGIPNVFYLEFVFQAREEMEYIGISRIIQYLSYLTLVFALLKSKEQIVAVPISYLVAYLTATLFLLLLFLKKYQNIYVSLRLIDSYRILLKALPIGFATIIYQAVMNFPVICLGILHGDEQVGLFSACFKIILLLLIVERIFYYLFFPIFSKQTTQGRDKVEKSFILFSQLSLIVTILISIVGIAFAERIVLLIYGQDFASGASILRVLLLYFIVAPLNTIWGYGLVALSQEKKFFKIIIITAILNLTLIIILGYLFKGIGVALAMFISEFLGLILMKKELNAVINFSLLRILKGDEIRHLITDRT